MGTTKTEFFTGKQNSTATILKALGHPARIAIIEYLLKVNTCICGDIVNELPLSQPTVSQHLKELKNARIIKGSIEGNTICYCLDETAMAKLRDYFGNIAAKLENNCLAQDACDVPVKTKLILSELHTDTASACTPGEGCC